ncbi:MAG: hypothetical protein ACYCZX_05855 [Rhodospirillaceae bacterium]
MRAFGKTGFTPILIGIFGIAGPAGAVDLVNRDRVERETVVNRSDGQSEVLTLKPGQRIANICTVCVILVGESSVEASGRVIVTIAGGRATVSK